MKYTRAIRRKRKALFQSVMSLILCFAMLTGTTFAWFSDSASSEGNIIQSGGLDVKLEYKKNFTDSWSDASNAVIFNYDQWEPGYSDVRYLQISNDGNLAFQYQITVEPVVTNPGTTGQEGTAGTQPNSGETASTQTDPVAEAAENGGTTAPEGGNTPTGGMPVGTEGTAVNPMKLAEVIDVYFAPLTEEITSREMAVQKLTKVGTLADMIRNASPVAQGIILPKASFFAQETQVSPALIAATESTAGVIMLKMRETAGNEYMGLSAGDGFTVKILATQYAYEADSFGTDYDTGAVKEIFPEFVGTAGTSATVNTSSDGKTTEDVTLGSGDITAMVPQGTQVKDGTRVLTLSVTEMNENQANIQLGTNDVKKSFDVHIEGLAENNTTPIQVNLGKIMPTGQNDGNVTLYHVENGTPVPMKQVFSKEELLNHNDFYYDPATGDVTVVLATFSEVALVADKDATWKGKVAESFAGGEGTAEAPYIIANADQLAYLGEVISNENDNYGDKHYKLIADINLGGEENANKGILFYPIGYHKPGNTVATVAFDDAPEAAYIIEEDTKTPVTMAAAEGEWYTYGGAFRGTFDGNGHKISNIYQNTWQLKGNYEGNYWNAAMGIFGYVYGGTVKNLTVDNFSSDGEFTPTGVITAYATNSNFTNIAITNCNPRVYNTGNGGIVGIGGNSSDGEDYKLTFQNITIDNSNKISALWGSWDVACGGLVGMFRGAGHVYMTNCHVAAQMDVYNDVCGNYQYYWYRYSGMMIGTNKNMVTDKNGYTVPETSKFHAEDCTVHFGDWNDYYYCEFVKNSLASYTHDHQMSRVSEADIVGSGHTATCRNHNHKDQGTEIINGVEVLKEDKQAVYLPFNQLFTGYGWGVKHIPVKDSFGEDAFPGITILDTRPDSIIKFTAVNGIYKNQTDYTIANLFNTVPNLDVPIKSENVQVTVSPVGEESTVSAKYTPDTTDWTKGKLSFTGEGMATVTITDYYFCTPTTMTVTIGDRPSVDKFVAVSVENYVSGTECTLGALFRAADNVTINSGDVEVSVSSVGEESTANAECTYDTTDWTQSAVKFTGVGKIEITITDKYFCNDATLEVEILPIEKFGRAEMAKEKYESDRQIPVGELFCTVDGAKISSVDVTVTVTPEDGAVTVEHVKDKTNWENGTVKFKGSGHVTLTITESEDCKPYSLELEITKRESVDKFAKKFTRDFQYRVGNKNTVSVGTLFDENKESSENVTISNDKVEVTVENVSGSANGSYTANTTDWAKGTIQFSGTGVVKVTITDNDYCNPLELTLEVVDAVNATSATSATSNNVVLLNDCGFSSLEVSGGYTLYGNGFTMTCGSDSPALDMGYAFVTLNSGTLDNVQIVCPNFDYAVLYKSNMTDPGNRTQETDKIRYYNVKSGVMASGNSQILNSRISGGRAALNVSGGNVLVDNSRIERGAVASILVGAANSLTLRDVTLVQKPTASTYDSSKTLMGFSVLAVCDSNGDAAPIILEGTLIQNAWVDENDKQYVPSAGQSIISTVLAKTDYLHDIDGNGTNESLNLGIAYMPESLSSKVNTSTITDTRTNKDAVTYDYAEVPILNGKTYVYSYKNTNGTEDSIKTEAEYKPNKNGDIIMVNYSDTADGLTTGKSFGTSGWVYELNVDLDKLSGYALDFSKLSMSVNGVTITDFKVNGNAKPTSPVAVTAGGVTYNLTATIDGKEYTVTYKVTGTETSKKSPTLVASNYEAGLCVASSYGGTWHGAAPALQGIQIEYWSVAEKQYKTINLSDYTPTTKGQLNGTNTTWTYSPANGDFTLTLTGGQVHSSNNVYAMPVVCDGKLYFVAASSKGLVNTGNSARAVPVSYSFKDNNNGDVLTFSHTWSVAENKDDQYKYSDFCNGTKTKLEAGSSSGGNNCIAEGTMITMADGTVCAVENLRKGDMVMAFDHLTGKITSNEVIIVVRISSEFYKNTFVFDDGTKLVTINEHGIYDLDLNRYVNISHENAEEYIGHRYVSVDTNGKIGIKKLVDVEVEFTSGYKYDIVTDQTLNYVAEDTLSVTHVLVDVINSFDFDSNMCYDQQKMQSDIAKYGLYTYDEWEKYCDISVFEQYNIPVMKVGISKGMYTKDYIIGLINTYVLDDSVQLLD